MVFSDAVVERESRETDEIFATHPQNITRVISYSMEFMVGGEMKMLSGELTFEDFECEVAQESVFDRPARWNPRCVSRLSWDADQPEWISGYTKATAYLEWSLDNQTRDTIEYGYFDVRFEHEDTFDSLGVQGGVEMGLPAGPSEAPKHFTFWQEPNCSGASSVEPEVEPVRCTIEDVSPL